MLQSLKYGLAEWRILHDLWFFLLAVLTFSRHPSSCSSRQAIDIVK